MVLCSLMERPKYSFRPIASEEDLEIVLEIDRKSGIPIGFSKNEINQSLSCLQQEIDHGNDRAWQESFVVYQEEKPVAFMLIEPEDIDGEEVMQHIGGFATTQESRSLGVLRAVLERLKSTQDSYFRYGYTAIANRDTSYRGLAKPLVKEWFAKNGVYYDIKIPQVDDDDLLGIFLEIEK